MKLILIYYQNSEPANNVKWVLEPTPLGGLSCTGTRMMQHACPWHIHVYLERELCLRKRRLPCGLWQVLTAPVLWLLWSSGVIPWLWRHGPWGQPVCPWHVQGTSLLLSPRAQWPFSLIAVPSRPRSFSFFSLHFFDSVLPFYKSPLSVSQVQILGFRMKRCWWYLFSMVTFSGWNGVSWKFNFTEEGQVEHLFPFSPLRDPKAFI